MMRKQAVGWMALGVLVLLLSIPTQALPVYAFPFHMTIIGEKQGRIDGGSVMKGREKTIECVRFQYTVSIPTDPQTGLPAGMRQHQPVVITHNWDQSSPKLFQACVTGEHLKQVEIKFYRLDRMGNPQHYWTIRLEDAIIQWVRQYANVVNLTDPLAATRGPELEDISFTFKKIKITWENDSIQAEDSWAVPRR